MMYKVGDRVRIVPAWTPLTGENPDGEMDKYLGTVMTIKEVGNYDYRMEEDCNDRDGLGWFWNEYSIVGLADETCEDIDILPML